MRERNRWLSAFAVLIYAFLFAPIVVLIVFSFNDSRRTFVLRGFTLDWYPRLQAATPAQRQNFEIMPMGVHWPDIDEDLSVAGMLKGNRAK